MANIPRDKEYPIETDDAKRLLSECGPWSVAVDTGQGELFVFKNESGDMVSLTVKLSYGFDIDPDEIGISLEFLELRSNPASPQP